MKTKFTKNNTTIDATTTKVIFDDGQWRRAKTMGGWRSRSGLTEEPWLVESGAKTAYAFHSLPLGSLYYAESFVFGDEERKLLVFEGHGTNPERIWEISHEEATRCWKEWKKFRKDGERLPVRESFPSLGAVFDAARRQSKGGSEHGPGYWVTWNEALGMWDELTVKEDEDGTEVYCLGRGSASFKIGSKVGMFHPHGAEGSGHRFLVGDEGGDWVEISSIPESAQEDEFIDMTATEVLYVEED